MTNASPDTTRERILNQYASTEFGQSVKQGYSRSLRQRQVLFHELGQLLKT